MSPVDRSHVSLVIPALTRALTQAGCQAVVSDSGTVLHIERPPKSWSLRVRTRSLPDSNERILEPLVLHVQRQRLDQHDKELATTLLVVVIPRFPQDPRRLLADIKQLIPVPAEPPVRWAIVSEAGGYLLQLDGILDERISMIDRPVLSGPALAAAALQAPRDPLRSDLTLTVLKILLAQRSNYAATWFGTKYLTPCTQSELAEQLDASVSSMHQTISTMRERGWVDTRRGGVLALHSPATVVGWWLDHAKNNPPRRIRLRQALERKHTDHLAWLGARPAVPGTSWALNGWSAIEVHAASILTTVGAHPLSIVLSGSVTALRDAWELTPCEDASDPRIILTVETTATPWSTFIGSAQRPPGTVLSVDLFQAALDVIGDSNRGIEQAVAIADQLFLSTQ